MNVWDVCLTHDPVYGGIHRSVENFATALESRVLSFDDGAVDRSALVSSMPVVRVESRPRLLNRSCHWVTPAMSAAADRAVAGADLLVVHSLFRGHAPWAAGWCARHARPYVSVLEGCLDPWGLATRPVAKRAWLEHHGRRYLAGAARVIAATGREAEKATAWLAPAALTVIHWPVPLPAAVDGAAIRAACRSSWGVPDGHRVLLFVGRLHPMKRPTFMLEAFLRAAVPECHLVVVGMEEGVTMAALRALVPREDADRVHVIGSLAGGDLTAAYHAADGFISLSHRENFGYAFAEAMAHGLPAIVSAGHDLAHDVGRGGRGDFPCGWLLPDESSATATAAIRAFAAASPAQLSAAGETGRAWVADHLSFDRFRDRLRRLAANVIG